jgi:hypothetical protein
MVSAEIFIRCVNINLVISAPKSKLSASKISRRLKISLIMNTLMKIDGSRLDHEYTLDLICSNLIKYTIIFLSYQISNVEFHN